MHWMAGAAATTTTAGKVPETPREGDGDTPDAGAGVEPDGKLASVGKKRTRTGCLNCRRKRRKCTFATSLSFSSIVGEEQRRGSRGASVLSVEESRAYSYRVAES